GRARGRCRRARRRTPRPGSRSSGPPGPRKWTGRIRGTGNGRASASGGGLALESGVRPYTATAAPGRRRRGASPHSGPRIVRNTSRQTPVQDPMTLEFALNNAAPASASVDCVVVGAWSDRTLTPAARALDEASGGRLAALAARGDIDGATGKVAMLHDLAGVSAPRVLVVGLGEPGKFAVPQYLKAIADAVRALKTGPVRSALLTLAELEVPGRDAAWTLRQAAIAAGHAAYRYTATLGEKNRKRSEKGLERVEVG